MNLTLLWFITKLLDLTYPLGLIPLVIFTWIFPWIAILWVILGVCGFVFGLKTWKYYVSKRDYWAKSEMERKDHKMKMAFWRLREFCYFGATLIALPVLYNLIFN